MRPKVSADQGAAGGPAQQRPLSPQTRAANMIGHALRTLNNDYSVRLQEYHQKLNEKFREFILHYLLIVSSGEPRPYEVRTDGKFACPDVMFSLVGQSIQPLVLPLFLLRPKKVVLVHDGSVSIRGQMDTLQDVWLDDVWINDFQGGRLRTRLEEEFPEWGTYLDAWPNPPTVSECEVDVSDPVRVYTGLRDKWREMVHGGYGSSNSLVDVTGGKNPMVIGAFDFAATHKLALHYIDFQEYDVYLRMPSPKSLRSVFIDAPGRVLRRADLQRAANLFDDAAFWPASRVLTQLVEDLKGDAGPSNQPSEAIDEVRQYADAVALWTRGDPWRAHQQVSGSHWGKEDWTEPLSKIASAWSKTPRSARESFEAAQASGSLTPASYFALLDLYASWHLLQVDDDPKAAFQRTCGVAEYLLQVVLWAWTDIRPDAATCGCHEETQEHIEFAGLGELGDLALGHDGKMSISWWEHELTSGRPQLQEHLERFKELSRKRNQVAHGFAVIKTGVARDALTSAAELLRGCEEWLVAQGEIPKEDTLASSLLPKMWPSTWAEAQRQFPSQFVPAGLGDKVKDLI